MVWARIRSQRYGIGLTIQSEVLHNYPDVIFSRWDSVQLGLLSSLIVRFNEWCRRCTSLDMLIVQSHEDRLYSDSFFAYADFNT